MSKKLTIDQLVEKAQNAFKKSKKTTGEIAEYWLGEDQLADEIRDAINNDPSEEDRDLLEKFIDFCESNENKFYLILTETGSCEYWLAKDADGDLREFNSEKEAEAFVDEIKKTEQISGFRVVKDV